MVALLNEKPTKKPQKHVYKREEMYDSPYAANVRALSPAIIAYRIYQGEKALAMNMTERRAYREQLGINDGLFQAQMQIAAIFGSKSEYDQLMVNRSLWRALVVMSRGPHNDTLRRRIIRLVFHWMKHFWDQKAEAPDSVPTVSCSNTIPMMVSIIEQAFAPINQAQVDIRYAHMQQELGEKVDEPELLLAHIEPFASTIIEVETTDEPITLPAIIEERVTPTEATEEEPAILQNGYDAALAEAVAEYVDNKTLPEATGVVAETAPTVSAISEEHLIKAITATVEREMQSIIEHSVNDAVDHTFYDEKDRLDRLETVLQSVIQRTIDERLKEAVERRFAGLQSIIETSLQALSVKAIAVMREAMLQDQQELERLRVAYDEKLDLLADTEAALLHQEELNTELRKQIQDIKTLFLEIVK